MSNKFSENFIESIFVNSLHFLKFFPIFCSIFFQHFVLQFINCFIAFQFAVYVSCFLYSFSEICFDFLDYFFRSYHKNNFHLFFTGFLHKFFLESNQFFDHFMTGVDGIHHHFFTHFPGSGFDHHNCRFGSRHIQVEQRFCKLLNCGIDYNFIIHDTHFHTGTRSIKGNIGNRKSSRSSQNSQHTGIVFSIVGKNCYNNVNCIPETIREKRSNWSVDETSIQSCCGGRPGFTFKKAARNFSGSIHFFDKIYCKRKEISSFLCFFFCRCSC